MSELSQRLRTYYPEFWTKTLEEEALLDKLHEIYSMWYASAYGELVQINNSYSIKTIDSYAYDYYSTVTLDDTNRFVPSDHIPYYDYCFYLPYGTFFLEALSYDSYFTDNIKDYRICFDKKQGAFFLAIHNREFSQRQPKLAFARVAHRLNVAYPWQHFFSFEPLVYLPREWTLVPGGQDTYFVPLMYDELDYIKAQYTNMLFAYTQGATYDSLDSLFAVTFRKVYAKRDGIVFDFNSTNVWINHGSVVVHYPVSVLKDKFKKRGTFVRQYEALEPSDVELIDWNVNPAKFAQLMIGRGGKLFESLIGIRDGERENALVYNDLELNWDATDQRYDMGGQLWPDVVGSGIFHGRYYGGAPWLLNCHWRRRVEDTYSELDYSSAYQKATSYWWAPPQTGTNPLQRIWTKLFEPFEVNYPEKGEQMVLHRYDYWVDIRYGHKFVYEMLRNIVIWQTELRSEYHPWIASVLQFFKTLHMKYVPSPMNGVAKQYSHGYGKARRRHYGGILCVTKHGYGNHRGRQYAGTLN